MNESGKPSLKLLWGGLVIAGLLTAIVIRDEMQLGAAEKTIVALQQRVDALEKQAAKNKEIDKMITDLFPPLHTEVRELQQKVAALEGAKAPVKKP